MIVIAKALFSLLLLTTESSDQKITHFLNRIGFGPRPGDVELVQKIGIDKYLEHIIKKMLAKDPAKRYQSAGEVLKYLRGVPSYWETISSSRD